MKFYITSEQREFLLSKIKDEDLILKLKGSFTQEKRKIVIDLSNEQRDRLDNELSNLFCSIGLQKNDEPNKLGLFIEDLIDIFQPN